MARKKGRNSSVTGMERGHGKYGVKRERTGKEE